MTFDYTERSNYDGIPTMLYEFSLAGSTWNYSGGQRDVVLNGITYAALAVSNEGYSSSGDPGSDDMTVSISRDAAVTNLYVGTPPSEPVLLNIRTLHRGDTDAPVVWAGSVKSGKQASQAEYQFTCNSLLSTLNRNGLRLSWGRQCPHALYDRSCKVDLAAFATAVQIGSVTGTSLSAAALASLGSGYLSGGFLSFTGDHGGTERRAIENHEGSRIDLLGATDGMSVGDWIMVHPGCDRTTATCETKFNNLPNYGGFPHLPNKSPFDGDPVF